MNDFMWMSLATVSREFDVIANFQEALNHFIKSGQVNALIIGFVLGYIFRIFTGY